MKLIFIESCERILQAANASNGLRVPPAVAYAKLLPATVCHHAGNAPLLRGAVDAIHPWQVHVQHFTVQKEQGAQGLVMGRCGYAALGCQHSEKGFNLPRTHHPWVLHLTTPAMPADEKSNPVQVNLFGTKAIVQVANPLPHWVKYPD